MPEYEHTENCATVRLDSGHHSISLVSQRQFVAEHKDILNCSTLSSKISCLTGLMWNDLVNQSAFFKLTHSLRCCLHCLFCEDFCCCYFNEMQRSVFDFPLTTMTRLMV